MSSYFLGKKVGGLPYNAVINKTHRELLKAIYMMSDVGCDPGVLMIIPVDSYYEFSVFPHFWFLIGKD